MSMSILTRKTGLALLACCLASLSASATAKPANAAPYAPLERPGNLIPDEYIVRLNKPQRQHPWRNLVLPERVQRLRQQIGGGKLMRLYQHALQGFSARLTPAQVERLRAHPLVKSIEPNQRVYVEGYRSPAVWGLDRLDQRDLPLDGTYSYPNQAGLGAHIYILDSGLNPDHQEFAGRIGESVNFVRASWFSGPDPDDWEDCNGHGTHVAGTAAGSNYGVAPHATVHAVRVLNCNNSGSTSAILGGLDWVLENHQAPAVANMSISTRMGRSEAVEEATAALVEAGIAVTVAAGNSNKSACSTSPAAEPSLLTVAASDNADQRASFSNYGECVDLFAPGVEITSASYIYSDGSAVMQGTSMAAPHVAGALAVLRALHPQLSATAAQDLLLSQASPGRIADPMGSPNVLLHVASANGGEPIDYPPSAQFEFECDALSCRFDAGASQDDGQLLAYDWHFGDGTTASGAVVEHQYIESGQFDVSLSVTDDGHQTDTITQTLTVQNAAAGPCADCEVIYGSLDAGDSIYLSSAEGFDAEAGEFIAHLRGPAGADFDIHLEKYVSTWFGPRWSSVSSGTSSNPDEDISYNGEAGAYRWRVRAYRGSGDFTLYVKAPTP